MKRVAIVAGMLLGSLALAACGTQDISGLGGVVSPAAPGSKLASSWVSQPSKRVAIHLTLRLTEGGGRGDIEVISTYSGALSSRELPYSVTLAKNRWALHLGGLLGTTDATLSGRRLTLLLHGYPAAVVLVPGTKKYFLKEAATVRRAGEQLGYATAMRETNHWITAVESQTTELVTFGTNVLGADVSLLQQYDQEEQSNLTWVQQNMDGSFAQFICIGFSGASEDVQKASAAYRGFQSDVATGDAEATELSQALATMESSYQELESDGHVWKLSINTSLSSALASAESGATVAEDQWPGSVSQYSSQASSYLTQISDLANQAEFAVLSVSPSGC